MRILIVLIGLWLAIPYPVNAQLFKKKLRNQRSSAVRPSTQARSTVGRPTVEQQADHRAKMKARAELAQQRQREMELRGQSSTLYPRLASEFEPQHAIMLSIGDWQPHHYPILTEIILKTEGHAELVILYNDSSQRDRVVKLLSKSTHTLDHVRLLQIPLNTIWLRDFGPRFAETETGQSMSVDFYYDGSRPKDDELPEVWSQLTDDEYNHVPWTLQGGNLITNGQGLGIASERVFRDNRVQLRPTPGRDPFEEQREFVIRQFKLFCNIKQLVLLKPLEHESTQHVDMFTTLLAPDLAVVARLDPRWDPRNARILDWNAQQLAKVEVNGSPMRVERIWIPPRKGKYWTPLTNIILTDRLVLVPKYDADSPDFTRKAIEVYQKLLPNHHVDTIDLSSMSKLEGALHCMSCNIPAFAKLPDSAQRLPNLIRRYQRLAAQSPVGNHQPERQVAKHQAQKVPLSSTPISQPNKETQIVGSDANQKSRGSVDHKSESNSASRSAARSAPQYSSAFERTLAAVETYRNSFVDQEKGESFEGYVVAVNEESIELVLEKTKEARTLSMDELSERYRIWVLEHREHINRNGPQVKLFLQSFK